MKEKYREFIKWHFVTPLRKAVKSIIHPRRVQIFGVGMGKTGTNSLTAVFEPYYRTKHEPEKITLASKIRDRNTKAISQSEFLNYLIRKDRRQWLEVDISQLNGLIIDELLKLYPNARFILTIREPISWLDSFINNYMTWGEHPNLHIIRDFYFKADRAGYAPEEIILEEQGFSNLDNLFYYWNWHNREILEKVPDDKLCVIRLEDFSQRMGDVAAFGGIEEWDGTDTEKHKFKARKKYHLLEYIDRNYLHERMMKYCGALYRRYYE